jgi:hypothetical protein
VARKGPSRAAASRDRLAHPSRLGVDLRIVLVTGSVTTLTGNLRLSQGRKPGEGRWSVGGEWCAAVPATCGVLTGFVHQVRAQRGAKIDAGLADALVADVREIMTALACG